MVSTGRTGASTLRSYRAREALLSDRSPATKNFTRVDSVHDYELRYLLCKQAKMTPHSRQGPLVSARHMVSPGKDRFYTPSSPWTQNASPSPTARPQLSNRCLPSQRLTHTPKATGPTGNVKQCQNVEEGPTADETIGASNDYGPGTGTTLQSTGSSLMPDSAGSTAKLRPPPFNYSGRPSYRESDAHYMKPRDSSRGEFRDRLSDWSARTGLPRQATHRIDMAMPIVTETHELWMDVLENSAGPSPYANLDTYGNNPAPETDDETREDSYRRQLGLPPKQVRQRQRYDEEIAFMMSEEQRRAEIERLTKLAKLRANWTPTDTSKPTKAERKKTRERLQSHTTSSRPNQEARVWG